MSEVRLSWKCGPSLGRSWYRDPDSLGNGILIFLLPPNESKVTFIFLVCSDQGEAPVSG